VRIPINLDYQIDWNAQIPLTVPVLVFEQTDSV